VPRSLATRIAPIAKKAIRIGTGTAGDRIRFIPYSSGENIMSRTKAFYLIAAAALIGTQAYAQTAASQIPPQNSKKLSQLIASVEQRDKFQYVKDIEWDDEGYYEVTYYTTDKAKVEIKLDPVSGQPK
jgi:hypothetical protein